MKNTILFDLDGTLLSTLSDLADGCNFALRSLGLEEHREEDYKMFVGSGRYKLVERAMGKSYTPELLERAVALNDEYYSLHGEDKTKPYDGVLEMLCCLKERGYKIAVVSNKPHQFCEVLVPKYFGNLVDVAFGCKDGEKPKPSPQTTKLAMEALGAKAEECVFVGDSGVDMQTAKNAGVDSVGVLWGFRSKAELLENGAVQLCEKVSDLPKILLFQK